MLCCQCIVLNIERDLFCASRVKSYFCVLCEMKMYILLLRLLIVLVLALVLVLRLFVLMTSGDEK